MIITILDSLIIELAYIGRIDMKKILPIDKECKLYSYTYHLFTNAISCNQMTTGNQVAKIRIMDEDYDDSWNKDILNGKLTVKNNLITRSFGKFENYAYASASRRCKDNDSITICILYQQYSAPWSSIHLFLSEAGEHKNIFERNTCVEFGNSCYLGLYFKEGNEYSKAADTKYRYKPIYLRLEKQGLKVIGSYSLDAKDWMEYDSCELKNESEYEFGIAINNNCREYYHWFYANYIQLTFKKDTDVCLDYHIAYKRNYSMLNTFFFLKMNHYDDLDIRRYEGGIWEYVRKEIDVHRYVILSLNEFYVQNRFTYQKKNYDHPNMIYGYDDKKQVVYAMGVNVKLQPICDTIPVKDFVIAYEKSKKSEVISAEYELDNQIYGLNLERIEKFLQDYLTGNNSSKEIDYFASSQDCTYGIDIYMELVKDLKNIKLLVVDKRITYVLYEHKRIMKDRVDYLYKNQVFGKEDYTYLSDGMQQICKKANSIMNLILRYDFSGNVQKLNAAIQYILELKALEEKYYNYLLNLIRIRLLEEKNEKIRMRE